MIIEGDNLPAMKSLLPQFKGKVKVILFVVPRIKSFETLDEWLNMLYPRLKSSRYLLAEDGSLCMLVKDEETHYAKVLSDEVFGRDYFVTNVVWENSEGDTHGTLSKSHENILIYARKLKWAPNKHPITPDIIARFKNPDNDPRGKWQSVTLEAPQLGGEGKQIAKTGKTKQRYTIVGPHGDEFKPTIGRVWGFAEATIQKLDNEGAIFWGQHGRSKPRLKKYFNDLSQEDLDNYLIPNTFWENTEMEGIAEAKNISQGTTVSDRSKLYPSAIIERTLKIASIPGDVVLVYGETIDTLLESAHKLNRRFIGIVPDSETLLAVQAKLTASSDSEFHVYKLGGAVFRPDGFLSISEEQRLVDYLWYSITGGVTTKELTLPYLGCHRGVEYFLLYGEQQAGDVLNDSNMKLLLEISKTCVDNRKVVFGSGCILDSSYLARLNFEFRQIPFCFPGYQKPLVG